MNPIPKYLQVAVALLGVLALGAAHAAEAPVPEQTDTQAWLNLQASGSAAPQDERPMPGEIADKVYQRYVDSFGRPIPESLKRDSFATSGGDSQ